MNLTLTDACEEIVDCINRTAPEDEGGDYYVVGTPAMRGNRIDYSEARRVNKETFDAWNRRLIPKEGDLLVAREAPVGPVVRIPSGGHVGAGQRTTLLRPNPAVVDGGFLYYYLISPAVQARFISLGYGSTTPHVRVEDVRSFALNEVPSLPEQWAIAEVLGALDDKIAANERVRQLADTLRRTTFRAGLVEACDETPLSATARFVNGRNFTKDASGTGRPVIRIAELNSGLGPSTVYSDIEPADDNVARAGDLLFAWSGSLTLRRWYLADGVVNQHIFKVLPSEGWPLWLVASLLERKLDDFKAIAADKATTMGHIQRRHLDEVVPVPSTAWLARHGSKLDGLWNAALAMEIESQRLAQLRDTLLPELMSGRMRVKDAETHVEGVL